MTDHLQKSIRMTPPDLEYNTHDLVESPLPPIESTYQVLSQHEMLESLMVLFRSHANLENALPMATYMKNQFQFLGLKKPERTKLQRDLIQRVKRDRGLDCGVIPILWDAPEREFQYLALDLLCVVEPQMEAEALPLLRALIVEKSWWDTVDLIASKLIGPLSLRYPELVTEEVKRWGTADNLWLRRSALLFQLKHKARTDLALLEHLIDSNTGTDEFFINKAIGWILREYSKFDPEWVRTFISQHPLHALSVREGSKYL
jgi:3-methyladenine DNA glycosylase AlkD